MKFILSAAFVLLASRAFAQTPIIIGPNSQLAWNEQAPTAALAQGLTYVPTVDGTVKAALTPVTCVADPTVTGQIDCVSPLSQFPIGTHTITLTAASGGLTSLPSSPFSYITVLIPVPAGLHVQ